MTTPLVQTSAITQACLPVPSKIRIKNLHTTIQGPHDAWGRPDRPQPLTVSATVSLNAPFGSSSATDKLSSDTVHYGLLSKAILAILAKSQATTLRSVLESLWVNLVGVDTRGQKQPAAQQEAKPFLSAAGLSMLEVTVLLPKASLLGGGVSLTATGRFTAEGGMAMTESALALRIHDLRVPTLIGVNSNERMAKQVVIANVEVDRIEDDTDAYSELEQVIVKEMSESSFETLEAFATLLTTETTKHLRAKHKAPRGSPSWHITIVLEKPIAVPMADAACVETHTDTNDISI